jgi:D-alanine-D-alanine ligase
MQKNILLICGGKSPEHEVSLRSAAFVASCVSQEYGVYILGISRQGDGYALRASDLKNIQEISSENGHPQAIVYRQAGQIFLQAEGQSPVPVHVGFPMIHGVEGEDGCLQGYLQFLGLPYVGAGVAGSAVCMNKRIMKQILQANGLPVVDFHWVSRFDEVPAYEDVCRALGSQVLFVKPCSNGSSVGIGKARNAQDYARLTLEALRYDTEILIEKAIEGLEIECSVMGHTRLQAASCLGQIIPNHDFYSYEAKYLDDNGAAFTLPAPLPDDINQVVRDLALQAFKVLDCSGMARADFFVSFSQTGQASIYINELNTIPGFTSISLYPRLWELSGISGRELVQALLSQAMEKENAKDQICLVPHAPQMWG